MSGETSAERYVADRMTPEEIAEFEARMMAEPAIAADVDVRQRIKAGLERLEEQGQLAPLLQGSPAKSRAPRYALAASLALALLVAGFAAWQLGPGGAPQEGVLASLTSAPADGVADSFLLALTRNQAKPTEIRVQPAVPVRLRVLADTSATGPFTVEFAGHRQTVELSPDGYVDVHLVAAKPGTSEYPLTVTPASGAAQTFQLRLVATP